MSKERKNNLIKALKRENRYLRKENLYMQRIINAPKNKAFAIDKTSLRLLTVEYFVSERYTAAIITPSGEEMARKELGYKLFNAIQDGAIKIYERKDKERGCTVYGFRIWVE